MKEYVNTGSFNLSGAFNLTHKYEYGESVSTGTPTITAAFTGRYDYGDQIKTDSVSLTVTLPALITYDRLTDSMTTGSFTITAAFS